MKNYRLDRATVLTYITSSGVGLTQIGASKFNYELQLRRSYLSLLHFLFCFDLTVSIHLRISF